MDHFHQDDLSYFDHCLGREPTRDELKIISLLLTKNRRQEHQYNGPVLENGKIIYKNKKLYYKQDDTFLKHASHGCMPTWINYTFEWKPSQKEFQNIQNLLLKRAKKYCSHSISLESISKSKKSDENIIHVQSIRLHSNHQNNIKPSDLIVAIPLPASKSSIKQEFTLYNMVQSLIAQKRINNTYYSSIGIQDLTSEIVLENKLGIHIYGHKINSLKQFAIAITSNHNMHELEETLSDFPNKPVVIGTIADDPFVNYYLTRTNIIKLPNSIFSLDTSLLIHSNPKNFRDNIIAPPIIPKHTKKDLINFYDHLLKKSIKRKVHKRHYLDNKNLNNNISSFTKIFNIFDESALIKFIIHNLGTHLSNRKSIQYCIIYIETDTNESASQFPHLKNQIENIFSSLQKRVVFQFSLNTDRTLISMHMIHENNHYENSGNQIMLDKNSNYFLSTIGVLKNEMNNSQFAKLFKIDKTKINKSNRQKIDVSAFFTFMTCLEENIIETGMQITNGGLSITVTQLLNNLEIRAGANVFISTKKTPTQLLFGESYGAFIVILKESKLMEFQRICINTNTQCSTIGRVINDPILTINDFLKVDL